MERRDFIKFCAASAAGAGTPGLAADSRPQFYSRAKLVSDKGAPLRAKDVPPNRNLIFHYPYASTPCFLLNLGRSVRPTQLKTSDNRTYEWRGGVGPAGAIVAYSAICAHKLSYPTRDISFISYRPQKSAGNRHANVIHCCSEHSQYDPAQGARVVAGPAPQPLAAILLDHDLATDEMHAVGTLGGEVFNEFFNKYAFKLALEHGNAVKAAAGATAMVQELENYCRQQVKC